MQALSWCCMHITFLQILLIFLSPEGYRLLFSIQCADFVYTAWHCMYWLTLQFYLCVYVSFVCWYVALPGECCYNNVLCCNYISSLSEVLHAFSVLCAYSKFGHPLHPLGYLCANFRLFHSLHCWASPWRTIAYSITRSLTDSAYLMRQEPKLALRNNFIKVTKC